MHYFVFMIRCTEVKPTVIVRKDMDGEWRFGTNPMLPIRFLL